MNYTNPDDKNYTDSPSDWLFFALTFSQALSTMLKEGIGVFIVLKGDAVHLHPESKKVIIFNDGKMIKIIDASERTDLKHGDWIQIIAKNDISLN